MESKAYTLRRVSTIGAITFLSAATMSTNLPTNTMTSSINNSFVTAGVASFNDIEENLYSSSSLVDAAIGDVVTRENTMDDVKISHEQIDVKLKITEIRRHVSEFDINDDYEEI